MQTADESGFSHNNISEFIAAPPWSPIPLCDARIFFLKNELDIGLTFTWMALRSRGLGWKQKVARNTVTARRAYDSLLRFRNHVSLNPSQTAAYDTRFSCLRERLLQLGEMV